MCKLPNHAEYYITSRQALRTAIRTKDSEGFVVGNDKGILSQGGKGEGLKEALVASIFGGMAFQASPNSRRRNHRHNLKLDQIDPEVDPLIQRFTIRRFHDLKTSNVGRVVQLAR